MQSYDAEAARAALERMPLGANNRELADYWLSLWRDGALPGRGAVNPARLVKFLPGLAILDLHPDDSIRYRIAGRSFRAAFGFDPSRHDTLALTPPEQRATRLARCRAIAHGTVATGIRVAQIPGAADMIAQDVMLPLGGVAEDGARSWIFHSSWRPGTSDWECRMPAAAVGIVDSYIAHRLV